MNPQVRKLTADIPNPKYDGRRRYGIEAVKVFKAGTIYKLWPTFVRENGGICHARAEILDRSVGNLDLLNLFAAASEVVVPANKAEVLAMHDLNDRYSPELIDKLLATGVITLAQFDAACAALRADYDA